jgi:hypothetical protein
MRHHLLFLPMTVLLFLVSHYGWLEWMAWPHSLWWKSVSIVTLIGAVCTGSMSINALYKA